MTNRTPAEVFPPGEFIRDELEARGWTQADLAEIVGRPLRSLNEIIAGKKAITPETAVGLAHAFGTSAELWMNLETAYRLSQVRKEGEDIVRRAKLYSLAPIKEMIKRQWIKDAENVEELESELKSFLGIASLEETPRLSFAARKSATYEATTPEQLAWVCRVRTLGKAVKAVRFKQDVFEKGLKSLRQLTSHEAEVRRIPALLAEIGVRLVVVEHLSKSRMDGATLWLNEQSPVVGLSMRYDRIDHFWFTLLHELSHVMHGDSLSVDEKLVGEDSLATDEKPESERRADREAAEGLIPNKEIESFILRVGPLYYRTKVIQFANRIRVHPGIIVGQLQRRGKLAYSQLRDVLVKVRDPLKAAALSDGWGFSPPIRE